MRRNVVLQYSLPDEIRRTEGGLPLRVSLLGSESIQANRLAKVLRYSRSPEVRHTEPSLCASVALFGGASEPAHCLDKVLRYSRSLDVRHTDGGLGASVSLFGKSSNELVQLTKYGPCTHVAPFGGASEPVLCFDKVLRYSRSFDVRATETELGVSVSLFGGKPELFDVLSTRRWGARHEHRHDGGQQQNEW